MQEGNPSVHFSKPFAENFTDTSILQNLILQLQDPFSLSHRSEAREVIQSQDNRAFEWTD